MIGDSMVDYITPIISNWSTYIVGNEILLATFFILAVVVWGLRAGWSIDVYAVVILPMVALLVVSYQILPTAALAVFYPVIGIVIAIAFLILIKRR